MSAPARANSTTSPADLGTFVAHFGRLPKLGDVPPPWSYHGWLLPYIVMLHESCSAVNNRWDYHTRTLAAGKLLDEPIPQTAFGEPDQRVFTQLRQWSNLIGQDCGGWSDFRFLLDWLLWALALSDEMPAFSEEVSEKLYRQVDLTPLLEKPYDYLGAYVAEGRAKGWNPLCFYPTPHCLVELMVRMTFHDALVEGKDTRTMSVCDPCVGSGRMLLHASNFSMNLSGQDIDPLAVSMCRINGALYAPWLAFSLPPHILATPDDE
jgi:hypothetical protein